MIMVRFAADADIDRVNELRRQVFEIHANGRPDMFKNDFDAQLQQYAYTLLHSENHAIVVSERAGEICGMACVDYVDKRETAYNRPRRLLHVQEIAVDAAHRRQGVAREIVDFLRSDARARGCTSIELDVWSFNTQAIEFYEAMGFSPYRQLMEINV